MTKMRAVQVGRAGGPLELVEREVPEPEQGEVRVRIEACGVCHSDSFTVEGLWPGLSFPRAMAGYGSARAAAGWRDGKTGNSRYTASVTDLRPQPFHRGGARHQCNDDDQRSNGNVTPTHGGPAFPYVCSSLLEERSWHQRDDGDATIAGDYVANR